MKKPAVTGLQAYVHAVLKIPMLICCLLIYNVSFAQQSNETASRSGDPLSAYLEKHSTTPLVKQYQQFPNEVNLVKLVRTAMILENPKMYGEFSESDIARMKQEYKSGMVQVENIENLVKSGMSYERAKLSYDNNQIHNKSAENTSSESIQPALTAPGN